MVNTGSANLDSSKLHVIAEMRASGRLAAITGIDFKTQAQTTLYTVPAGKTLFLTDVVFIPETISALTVVPTIAIGKTASWNDWLTATPLTALVVAGKSVSLVGLIGTTIRQTYAATEVVKVDVTVGATATTLTGTLYPIGFLI